MAEVRPAASGGLRRVEYPPAFLVPPLADTGGFVGACRGLVRSHLGIVSVGPGGCTRYLNPVTSVSGG
jgi:hypothetical protein